MSICAQPSSLQDFPHFKSEWRQNSNCFRHLYSSDLCELRILRKVPMKELDLYSSREAYSHPFCPRVYKYSIDRNELIDSQLAFDIKLLLQYVPERLSSEPSNEQITSKIIDILRGLEYLRLRYGPFRVKNKMIGWTNLGVAKVWINQDFSANFVEEEATSAEQMLQDIFNILSFCDAINRLKYQGFSTLQSMIEHIEENPIQKNPPMLNKEALKQIQNFNNSDFSFDQQQKRDDPPEIHSTKSRKNITFSYSNKNIADRSMRRAPNASKRSSIALIDDDFRLDGILQQVQAIPARKGLSFSNHQPSSLKIIQQKKNNQKKVSVFRPIPCDSREETKIKKLSDHFLMSSQINLQNQAPKIKDIYRHSVQQKSEYLHYSTSSNPYSKLTNKSIKQFNHSKQSEFQQASAHQLEETISDEGKQESSGIICPLDKELTEFTISEKRQAPVVQAEQLVKDDLDALFNSDHEFDYGELENQLDHVLF